MGLRKLLLMFSLINTEIKSGEDPMDMRVARIIFQGHMRTLSTTGDATRICIEHVAHIDAKQQVGAHNS